MKPTLHREYLSTTEVADALGVSVSSVKRWVEDGILPAQKTAGGHRKLLLADVLELARRSNLPIRNTALVKSGGRRPRTNGPEQLSERLYNSLVEGDSETVRSLVASAYRNGVPMETLADAVIAPAMHRLGRDWETGRLGVMHEHRGSRICAAALYELKGILESRADRKRPIAVGGAIEGDLSELPTLLAQMVLLDAGWAAINLGPNTPMESLRDAIAELKPRLAWLSASHLADEEEFRREYRRFYRDAERSGVAVVVGGRALSEPLRAAIPYTAYGDGLSHLAAFARTLHPRPRRPKRGRPSS